MPHKPGHPEENPDPYEVFSSTIDSNVSGIGALDLSGFNINPGQITVGSEGIINEVFQNLANEELARHEERMANTNSLPSLPSISNVGATPFTGVVNWNAIPGGFQPLPQTAGGKKKLYQLSQFHGGINQKSSPRDIADFECQKATNVSVSNVGRIKLLGDCLNEGTDISADSIDSNFSGYGLFQFTAPVDHDAGNVGETVFTCVANGDEVDVHTLPDGKTASWITGLGTTDDATVCQIYYAGGNGLYIADANFAHANSTLAKIYTYRDDINGDVEIKGWTQGKPLIDSPGFHASTAAKVELLGAHPTGSLVASRCEVTVIDTDTGSWDGTYTFYLSWVFDGGIETGLSAIGTETFDDESCDFNISISHQSGAEVGGDRRIDGGRVYFKKSDSNERWLLGEFSNIDGVKGALDTTWTPWDTGGAPTYDLATNINFGSPPEVYSYASLNGYYANEVYSKSPDATGTSPTAFGVRYKTVAVGQNGVVFIGNVNFDGKHMPDTMMYSMAGKPGLFPKFNFFDSPSSDGSQITALAAFQDTILQFKENAMYVINISNPAQFYAEAAYRDCGVFNPCQVFTTAFGIIFANKNGCFVYDGQKVISLTNGKFDWVNQSGVSESTSNATDGNVPCVGYDPRSQSIVVLKNIGDDSTEDGAWIYNMTTQSWTEGDSFITNADGRRHTNFIITNDGYLAIKRDNEGNILKYDHDKSVDTGDQTINYSTKDLDFGLPSQTKKIFKVYVTYFSDDSTVPTLTYGKDGGALTGSFDAGAFASSGGLQTTAFTVNDTDLTGIKSLALKISGSADHSFEIQDISILYRVRPIK
tara:strand:+ start:1954 stop:4407 length:2454 start_codon:yes stop_codon:yes gene_type:complete